MPKATDSDQLKGSGQTIVFTCNVDCPSCSSTWDEYFDTGKFDEDGLTDLEPDELTHEVACPTCGETFDAEFTGWMNYGDA